MRNEQKREFLDKLKSLLDEYDVYIHFACDPCSDTYGIYDGGIAVCENRTGEQVLKTNDWYLDGNNINDSH